MATPFFSVLPEQVRGNSTSVQAQAERDRQALELKRQQEQQRAQGLSPATALGAYGAYSLLDNNPALFPSAVTPGSVVPAPSSLGWGTQASNLSQGLPANAVGTAADGGFLMADGSTMAPSAFESQASAVLPYAGAALGAYGLYDLGQKWGRRDRSAGGALKGGLQGAASGAAIGNVIPGVGAAIGAGIGGAYGLLSSLAKAGKHKDQQARDVVRKGLVESGFLGPDYSLTLPDGTVFDMGKDGGAVLTNPQGKNRRYYDVDFENPLSGQAVGLVQPLAALLARGDRKLTTDFAGYLTNAITANAKTLDDVRRNAQAVYDRLGASPEQVSESLRALKGKFSEEELNAFLNGVTQVGSFGPRAAMSGGAMPMGGGFSISLGGGGPTPPPAPPMDLSALGQAAPRQTTDVSGIFNSALGSILGGANANR